MSSRPPANEPPRPAIRVDARPVTSTCRELYERGDHALIGVSAGNGYFTARRLAALLSWACEHFTRVDVVYADLHVDTMFVAEGATPVKARARARKKVKDTVRRIGRAVDEVGAPGSRIRTRAISECVCLPGYQAVQRRIQKLAAEDERVGRTCEEHVRFVLGGWVEDGRPRDETGALRPEAEAMVRAGLAYLHAELPFLLDTPGVFDVPTSVCCYHKFLPVVRGLWGSSVFNGQAQGHVVVRAHE